MKKLGCIAVIISFAFISCKKEEKRLKNFMHDNDAAMMNMMDAMNAVPMTQDNDLDFAKMMIHHHQGAVDMVDVLLKYNKHEDMRILAGKVRDGNVSSISRLNAFIYSHGAPMMSSDHAGFMADHKLVMNKMHETMMAAHYTSDPDYDFAQMMIHHHQGAIDMAQLILKHGSDQGAKDEARMILDQEKEIIELAQWLNSHGEPQNHKKK